MQKKQLSAIIGAAMGLALAAPAAVWAQAATDPMADPAAPTDPMASDIQSPDQMSFEQLDGDGDGIISRQEAEAHADLLNAWSDVDTNADDQVDQAEFSAFEADSGMTGQEVPGAQPDSGADYGTEQPGMTEEPAAPGGLE